MDYRDSLFKVNNPKIGEFQQWASMGPLYKSYGWYIIRKYPLQFVTGFLWPNAKKYFASPIEALESYNAGIKTVTPQAQVWFGYTKTRVKTRMYEPETKVLDYYPVLAGIMNMVMLFGLLYYILLKGWQ